MKSGGRSATQIRTLSSFLVIISLPKDSWFQAPEILFPFRSFSISQDQVAEALSQFQIKRQKNIHVIVFAQRWKALLEENPFLSAKEIAEHQGLSDSRVREIIRLNKLEPSIQAFLENLRNPQQIRFFGYTKLAYLTKLSHSEQVIEFEKIRVMSRVSN